MSTVSNDIDIDLPVSTVYNQWTQFEDFPAFMSGVKSIRQLNDELLNWKVSIAGVDREFDARIVEQIPDERISWRSISGPEQSGVVTFHRIAPDKTRIRLALEWEPHGFVEWAGAALMFDDATVSSDLRKFKKIIEDNGFATGAWRGSIEQED